MLTRTLFASGYGGQIYTLSFNPTNASISISSSISAGSAPTWLSQHPTQDILYTGDEFSSPNGTLSTFKIDSSSSSSLSKIGETSSTTKEGPVHFVSSLNGMELYTACYSGGALSTTKLLVDGTFNQENKGQNFVYGGKGQNPERQEGPHAHGVAIEPTGQFLFCTDLGTDQVHVYEIKRDRINYSSSLSVTRGSGPRHLIFSQTAPNRSLLYLVSELSNTVSIYEVLSPPPPPTEDDKPPINELPPAHSTPPPVKMDTEQEEEEEDVKPEIAVKSEAPIPMSTVPAPPPVPKPIINPIQLDVSILPPSSSSSSSSSSENNSNWTAAELELSRCKKYLYVSNRAPVEPSLPETDILTIFNLDQDGRIIVPQGEGEGEGEVTSFKELGGVGPRHFMLSPPTTTAEAEEEKVYMAVAFQRSNEVVVYQVEGKQVNEIARVGGIEGATCVIWKK